MGGINLLQELKGGLIVSCQALPDEPLFGSSTMAKVAKAAYEGGAVAIRANSAIDIKAIKQAVDLPIIGLVKREYPESGVFITPTQKEVDELLAVDVDIIAIDATTRKRPNGESLAELIKYIQQSGKYVMADISTYEEGMIAAKYGADCLSTTLSGYTPYSPQIEGPDFELIKRLVAFSPVPVFGEGKITTPEEAKEILNLQAHAVVVGSAITRPQLITQRFVDTIVEGGIENEQKTIEKPKLRVDY